MPQTYYLGSRSGFVTLTAWCCIVLAACLCSLGLVPEELEAPAEAPSWLLGLVPRAAGSWLLGGILLLGCGVLAGSVGLLLRQEWARRAFIGLLGFCIVAALAGLWVQHLVLQALMQSMTLAVLQVAAPQRTLPAELRGQFGGLAVLAQWMAALVTLAICAGLGWMIGRLRSPGVRQEFQH